MITFGSIEVENHEFHQHKSFILIHDVKIDKIVVSNKVPFGKKGLKYFISYKDVKKFKPLCVMLSKRSSIEEILMKLNIYLF